MPSLAVRIVPFGDRLGEGSRASREPLALATNGRGEVSFTFPSWTHVVVEADHFEVGCGLPVPDSVRVLELRAVPLLERYVEIVRAPSVPERIEAIEPKSGRVVAVLERVRKIAGQRALYRITEPRAAGRVSVRFSNDSRPLGVVELDLSGGESEAISIPSPELLDRGYG
jgi:hypothetical protein